MTDAAVTTLIRVATVTARTGLGRATVYAMMRKGSFPKNTKIGPRAVAWLEQDVADWINSRAERPGPSSSPDQLELFPAVGFDGSVGIISDTVG